MIKDKDKISIVIPIYRVEKYLKRCIESVISQTYTNIEIILVNDGSDDRCPMICEEYRKKDKRIITINKKNGGLSEARNYGIQVSTGKYITFIDSDDYVDEDYVEFLYNQIKKDGADISICAYKAIYDNGTILSQETGKIMTLTAKETLEKMLYQEDFNVSTWAKMYKKDLFDDIAFPVGKIFEDSFTTYKLVLKSSKISCNMLSKYNYMIRGNSILTSNFSMNKLLLVDAYEEMGKAVLKTYPELEEAVKRGNVYSRLSTLRQMINCKPRLNNIEKEYKRYIDKYFIDMIKNCRVPKRDKIAVIILRLGLNTFKMSWNMYCKFTGRNM